MAGPLEIAAPQASGPRATLPRGRTPMRDCVPPPQAVGTSGVRAQSQITAIRTQAVWKVESRGAAYADRPPPTRRCNFETVVVSATTRPRNTT